MEPGVMPDNQQQDEKGGGALSMRSIRIASFIVLTFALCAVVFCFLGLSAESLPYQDPAPQMLISQERNIRWWQAGLLVSLVISSLAVISIWLTRTARGAA